MPMKIQPKLREKLQRAIRRWPTRSNSHIAKNYKGLRSDVVQAVRASMGDIPNDPSPPDKKESTKMINLVGKVVLDHRPPDSIMKHLRKIPVGKAEALADFAKRIGRAPERVRVEAKGLGCCKWVDRGGEDWECVVMHPDTAQHYNG